MEKMWAGRFQKELAGEADDFNSSIRFDSRMFRQDIAGSICHAQMLASQGIITKQEGAALAEALSGILADLESGALSFDPAAEDIHMFIETVLTQRIGDLGKKLHTARSRNDQVALDLRLYLRDETIEILALIHALLEAVLEQAKKHASTIMPGYTHLQRAQPITFGHHLLAYCMMLIRDCGRLKDAFRRMNQSPLGSCALAGTTYATDRAMTAGALGFDGYTLNSIDGVSDRDFCVELMSAYALIMTHLSRFSEEIILWASWEFKFVELDDGYTTGSSIMPQKKNPDMAELVRGKTGRVYGNLMALLTTLKGLPLAYNKDMQEDKEAVFDSIDTLKKCLRVFAPMVRTMRALPENMYAAAQKGFINATDLADYLVKKGLPFRSAYKMVGQIVARAIADQTVLDQIPLDVLREFSLLFEEDVYKEISLETCVSKRVSAGGTGPASVAAQIAFVEGYLKE
ncbi:MAG: argininosuccinate lyase [Clostridiales bacterium]|nr:MAG: argininosuccinate lyase [Clostridiales bacterium]